MFFSDATQKKLVALAQRSDILFSCALVSIIFMMILPLPTIVAAKDQQTRRVLHPTLLRDQRINLAAQVGVFDNHNIPLLQIALCRR